MPKKIDYTDFKFLFRSAYDYAGSRGMWRPEIREEFAQEYCLAVFLGKIRDLRFQYVDFLRDLYGRSDSHGTPKSIARSKAERGMASYSEVSELPRFS